MIKEVIKTSGLKLPPYLGCDGNSFIRLDENEDKYGREKKQLQA